MSEAQRYRKIFRPHEPERQGSAFLRVREQAARIISKIGGVLMYNHHEAVSDLINWGRAMNDDWLEHNLMPKGAGIFREYQPEAGNVFDPEPTIEPIDQQRADTTEKIVVQIGLQDFDAHQALVLWYCHHKNLEEISKHCHWSVPHAKRRKADGERMYYELTRGRHQAAA